jgi:hypothetical protein
VSNAGIQIVGPLESFKFSDWKSLLGGHLNGAFLTTRGDIGCRRDCYSYLRLAQRWRVVDAVAAHSIVAAVKEGRVIFRRIQTYTLNSIIKKIVTGAAPDGWPDHDRACNSDPAAHGHCDDRRRFSGDVIDD